eukprot:TRINITY_DN704_c0_g1_i1.p1 TRINITY_DN704_c0_g1~~TRINITY_DN704_c0_g1_i1.p1  ORF type:complete len:143 (+),score=26.75 TRINITY_DN704_c0_g1_i1:83-511(+)
MRRDNSWISQPASSSSPTYGAGARPSTYGHTTTTHTTTTYSAPRQSPAPMHRSVSASAPAPRPVHREPPPQHHHHHGGGAGAMQRHEAKAKNAVRSFGHNLHSEASQHKQGLKNKGRPSISETGHAMHRFIHNRKEEAKRAL